jgi:hypothetical protein
MESMENAGTTYVGFYGTLADLYDSAGPTSRVVESLKQLPTTVQGLAIDPAFVTAAEAAWRQAPNTTLYALLARDMGPYNEFAYGTLFQGSKIMFTLLFSAVAMCALVQLVYPLFQRTKSCTHSRGLRGCMKRTLMQLIQQLDMSTWIKLCSIYGLVVWSFWLPYKWESGVQRIFTCLALTAALVMFCLLFVKWAKVANEIHDRFVYRVLVYWSYGEIGVGTLALMSPVFNRGTPVTSAFYYLTTFFMTYVFPPTVLGLAILYFICTTAFLIEMKRNNLPATVEWKLRKFTILCIVVLCTALVYFTMTTLTKMKTFPNMAFYIAMFYVGNLCWLLLHTTAIVLIGISIPTNDTTFDHVTIVTDDSASAMECAETLSPARESNEALAAKWNQVLLQGITKSAVMKREQSKGSISSTESVEPVRAHRSTPSDASDATFNSISAFIRPMSVHSINNGFQSVPVTPAPTSSHHHPNDTDYFKWTK